MTKNEFLIKFNEESINLGEYIMVLDKLTDEPLVMGCVFDNEVWKIYKTKERGGHYVIKEFKRESEAFDYFYELVLSRHNRLK